MFKVNHSYVWKSERSETDFCLRSGANRKVSEFIDGRPFTVVEKAIDQDNDVVKISIGGKVYSCKDCASLCGLGCFFYEGEDKYFKDLGEVETASVETSIADFLSVFNLRVETKDGEPSGLLIDSIETLKQVMVEAVEIVKEQKKLDEHQREHLERVGKFLGTVAEGYNNDF